MYIYIHMHVLEPLCSLITLPLQPQYTFTTASSQNTLQFVHKYSVVPSPHRLSIPSLPLPPHHSLSVVVGTCKSFELV